MRGKSRFTLTNRNSKALFARNENGMLYAIYLSELPENLSPEAFFLGSSGGSGRSALVFAGRQILLPVKERKNIS
ncbi:hypothetical protein JNB91_26220 [Rhizobium wenxiniae]|uniref:hypothetical protein n=1 Tax=Rhizobium wenxiniae TaxID=1737357 RepID=UPI001C6DE5F9|nr:hypothetical protein [Rhizobium wenxiniae]MBW9091314.1 hypothetical protein [Rhizobium wenxiniae]